MIVADASVAVDLLVGGGPAGATLSKLLNEGEVVCAPYLIDAEVGQVLRRFALRGELTAGNASQILEDFLALPIKKYSHARLVTRAFEFWSNVTVYDGIYLALAEALQCPLVTGDRALGSVPGTLADVEVISTSN